MSAPGWALLRSELATRKRPLAMMALWTLAEALPAALSGRLVAQALDDGFLAGRPALGVGWLLALGAVSVVGAFGQRQVYPHVADVVEPLRDALTTRVVGATLRAGTGAGAGGGATAGTGEGDTAAVSRLARQVETVRDCVAGQLLIVRHFAVTVVFVLLGAASLAPGLLPRIALPLGAALLAFVLLLPRLTVRQVALLEAEEELAELASRTFAAVGDITACGAVGRATARLDEVITAQTRARQALARTGALRRLTVAAGAHLPAALILLDAGGLVRGGLPAGAVVGALAYVTMSLEPALRTLVQGVGASGLRLTVALERLARRAAVPPASAVPAASAVPPVPAVVPSAPAVPAVPAVRAVPAVPVGPPPPTGRPRLHGHAVELDRVSFTHHPQADPILDRFSLRIEDGEHLAIVGPSGIGKSTVADLMAGLAAPTGGTVRLGGVEADELTAAELAAFRVLVPQEAYVFAGTLRENLAPLGPVLPGPDGERLAQAVRLLGLGPVVRRLGGLDARLGGAQLSTGERQLVALVRTYLSPARVVLLDEATSHLDPAAEAVVETAFRRRPGTLVVIAHRISSALRADRIVLLDGEPVVGTHAELLAAAPGYRELVAHWENGAGRGAPPDRARARPTLLDARPGA
ncbi:ATP-binding cassette domain-containing protein [Kitasatospora sp. NPDC056138]|uniref:ATP-binding cassette domain-containing protein n=1 Tax=Kitasatospora sp. NPDC056138 TaxID=3345724 RepID=UPI0035D8CD89